MRFNWYVIAVIFLGVSMDSHSAQKTLKVTSKSFKQGESIPSSYSYTQENISPNLTWSKGPKETKSYAVICDDPDAPRKQPWVHWVVFNIPAEVTELAEGSVKGQEGTNDYGKTGWGGPNPPSGTHRYNFNVYALSDMLPNLSNQSTKKELMKAMEGKVLAQGTLMGTYTANK